MRESLPLAPDGLRVTVATFTEDRTPRPSPHVPFRVPTGSIVPYYAHSTNRTDFSDWQPLADHLRQVADLAREFAQQASPPGDETLASAAWAAGLLHDLGKYRPAFQRYITVKGSHAKGDPLTFHKQAGAAKAYDLKHPPAVVAILGHHGGMPDFSEVKALLRHPAGEQTAKDVWPTATVDCPELASLAPLTPGFNHELFTRILFSCLVDADWTNTGEHERQTKNLPVEPKTPELQPAERLKVVLDYIGSLAAVCQEDHIKRIRASILDACLTAADQTPGLFSLTVPTGGGKTLAGLAFALKHAAKSGLRRVIYVAPYMSILEQNIRAFREALGIGPDAPDLFEHYSLSEPPDSKNKDETAREAAARRAQNWDAPFIVTTNVQFFESLFSNQPSQCRKLHNIARSVVILDECQTLPPGLVAPTCAMLKQLATELGTTIVLCTATQPAFNHDSMPAEARLDAREIIPKTNDLYGQLKRVHVTWPKKDAKLEWPEVAERMRKRPSALCVVNTKKAARAVYDQLKELNTRGLFHLSTAMCPAHRRVKLDEIRRRLAKGKPCFVCSTQLIEAGVDVDFPYLMREMAPLESIVQAAGRCNREGRIKGEGGEVEVFRSVEGKLPPDRWYKAGLETLETSFLARDHEPQIDDPASLQDYFRRLYYSGGPNGLDDQCFQAKRQKFQFETIAEGETANGTRKPGTAYRLIDNAGQPVVVKWEPVRSAIEAILSDLNEKFPTRPRKALYRELSRYQVNLFPHQILKTAHLIHEESSEVMVWDGKYDDDAGIVEEMADNFIL